MPRISAYRLKHIARVYAALPGERTSLSEILEMVGASADALDDPNATIELLHEAGVVEALCREVADKTFAGQIGLAAGVPGTLVAYLIRASDTVEDAIKLAQRFYTIQDSDLRLELSDHKDCARLTLESGVIPAHQYPRHRELLLCGLFRRIQQITSGGLTPLVLELETDDLDHCKRLSELAACEVVGNCPIYAIRLPKGAKQFAIPTADPALLEHLRQHGEAQLRASPGKTPSLSERITALLEERLPGRAPNGDRVAEELGMTRRTMTRKLSAEGTSFKELLEATLCELSKHFLRSGESIAQIAFMLDFADQAAFSVAFKRWTGETPARYRRAKK